MGVWRIEYKNKRWLVICAHSRIFGLFELVLETSFSAIPSHGTARPIS